MQENNGLYKTIASASAAAILGILFYYFMQAHFAYLNKSNELIMKSIETQTQLIETVDRLDTTISKKSSQAELRAIAP